MLTAEQIEAERKWIEQWWSDKVGLRPVVWTELNHEQQVLLASWTIFAHTHRPTKSEDLPVDYLQIIHGLCHTIDKVTGKRARYKQTPYYAKTGLVHGKRRHVKARKKRSQLAT